ncbi:DUF4062 domain-containing protein [Lentzea sp.]|uniref:DUF4062 domain-containing protein n=1 Tax=Lentzea sp. TaxID=56099 RepID=UPI002C86C31B|nr:DUF4062 domain-containing protein [Lentzea sp.]HUQ59959.1 DUF4062 domain-containing protein [Lentzea sp.]
MAAPRQYPGVMVSSTFADLRDHRAALMSAIQGQQLFPVAMEFDSALPDGTVLDSSLRKVREAAGYVGIVSHRYGQVPVCPRNPDGLSLTHLEYREAVRLGRPILIFIMGADHPITLADVERDPAKQAKLDAFREEVKLADGELQRVYRVFTSLADFTAGATQSVADLRRLLESEPARAAPGPTLYARPRYLGSHPFVGRQEQLTTLSDWASEAESRTVLLFEAIGGTGKSILTWEWINHYAPGVRDWAGRFWYSFYEAGAVMADFCHHALAYMTGQPIATFAGRSQAELGELLLRQLESRPWLLVLDGLERVLVAYHRYDAAQLLDEDAGSSDEIGDRHPCAAIRSEDEDLLRRLAAASPSKILISSRLVPRVLLNQSSQAIPGVLHQRLPGLRPADAEALMRGCGVMGDGPTMRAYLQRHCDCHPLLTGIVAGLVNDYLPARGDFDAWSEDADAGGSLDIGELNLVQKRNHILREALGALPGRSRQLLSTLAMLSEAVRYDTLSAICPQLSADDLRQAVSDLERRGLLQYDWQAKDYDLHPVVRGVAAGDLPAEERRVLGQHVVDHFSEDAHGSYGHLSGIDELRGHITVVRTLLQMGRLHAAFRSYDRGLGAALCKLEAAPEVLSLLRPFFGRDWTSPQLQVQELAYLWTDLGSAFDKLQQHDKALELSTAAVRTHLEADDFVHVVGSLTDVAVSLRNQNRLARGYFVAELGWRLSGLTKDARTRFTSGLQVYRSLTGMGRTDEADVMWSRLDLTRKWDRHGIRAGAAELARAEHRFDLGLLDDRELDEINPEGRRFVIRGVRRLRGRLHLEREEWAAAADEFDAVIGMARQTGVPSPWDEGALVLARLRQGRLPDPRAEIERLPSGHVLLPELWLAAGERERAVRPAIEAYRFAWADGEPYVNRYLLSRAVRILDELGVPVPVLPPCDPAKDPELPCEAAVRAYLDKVR